ncbi:DUF6881 domain-containing protein [Amycolatopsis samaneae]|uniref:DUF6881 domain-containing protein n=1 Tax=Amycolatopsis samaneae TaxID=664691 RepID=A0ABW5G8L9_9PSEU
MASWFLRVEWRHDFEVEPVETFGEIGEDGYEIRRVEVYRDGRMDWADAVRETDRVFLAEAPMPPLEEINAQAEFSAATMERADFEAMWERARTEGWL